MKTQLTEQALNALTPKITPPVSCSIERTNKRPVPDSDTTPTASPRKLTTVVEKGTVNKGFEEEEIESLEGENRVRRSDRIITAKMVEKLGGIEYFYQ